MLQGIFSKEPLGQLITLGASPLHRQLMTLVWLSRLPGRQGNLLVLLPTRLRLWLLDWPHKVNSIDEVFTDLLVLDVSLMDPQVQSHPLHIKAIFRQDEPIIRLNFGWPNALPSVGYKLERQ